MALALKTTKGRIAFASLFAIFAPSTLAAIPLMFVIHLADAKLSVVGVLINYLGFVLFFGLAPFTAFVPGWVAFHRRGLRWKAAMSWGAAFGALFAIVAYLVSWLIIKHNFTTLRQFFGVAIPAALILGAVEAANALGVWWIAYRGSPTPGTLAASFD